MDKGQLLDELRIDRQAPEPRSRTPWYLGGAVVVLLIIAAAGWMLASDQRLDVEAATAVPPATQSGGATAILQATGYVTARRQATVSAQITGTLIEVLIEEGERVEAGQV